MTPQLPVAREASLLFGCARGRPDPAALREIAARPIDWPAFLQLAQQANLTALCGRRLEQACPDAVPPEILEAMRLQLRQNAQRNLFLSGELLRVLECLSQDGVKALAFKGPVLAWSLYGHPGLRRFHDLDILVDPADLDRTMELFASLDYYPDLGRRAQTKIVPSEGQVSLFRAAPPASVDLHWNLAPHAMGLKLDARHLLPRAVAVTVAGRPVLTFGPEDQLLLCAFHGSKHGWSNPSWLADLSALMETRPPDWPRVLAEARRKRLSRALFVGLRLAYELLGTPIPSEIRRPLERDRAARALAAEARRFLLNLPATRSFFPREMQCEFRLTESWAGKAAYVWRKLTQPSSQDWEMPASIRPFRLAGKYALRLAGLQ